jgi:two-component system response regulator CpxR
MPVLPQAFSSNLIASKTASCASNAGLPPGEAPPPKRRTHTAQGNSDARSTRKWAGVPVDRARKTSRQPATERAQAKCCQTDEKTEIEEGVNPPIMRPKKVILCVDDNEQELSVLKFMLATNGYRVVSASNGQEAIGILPKPSGPGAGRLCHAADERLPTGGAAEADRGACSHDPAGRSAEDGGRDARRRCAAGQEELLGAGVLERIKVMSARKRGPRKGSQRQAPPVELAVAS